MSVAENEIMKYLWTKDTGLSVREICDYLESEKGKTWKPQTVRVFLNRLKDKGYLNINVDEKTNKCTYIATQPRGNFLHDESKKIVNELFGGSIYDFVAAFSGGNKISKEDAEKLKKLLEE
jgi:BlaI family penicillinase repressor